MATEITFVPAVVGVGMFPANEVWRTYLPCFYHAHYLFLLVKLTDDSVMN